MKKLAFICFAFIFLFPTLALAKLPAPIIKEAEVSAFPKFKGLSQYITDNKVESSALGEHGILTLLQLTPQTAEAKFGAPKQVEDRYKGDGKSYEYANGMRLLFYKDKLASIFYHRENGVNLPFKASTVAWLGLDPKEKCDFENDFAIRWKGGPDDEVKEVSILAGPKENDVKMVNNIIVTVFVPEQ